MTAPEVNGPPRRTLLDFALTWVALGFKIFPLAPGRKTPAIPRSKGGHGFKDASSDPAQIIAWDDEYPGCNWGAATGAVNRLLITDVDVKWLASGMNLLNRLMAGWGIQIPPTVWVSTPNGGCHYYLMTPPGVAVPTRHLEDLDFQGDGAYVVLPPARIRIPRSKELDDHEGVSARDRVPVYGGYTLHGPPVVAPCPPGLLEAIGRLESTGSKRKHGSGGHGGGGGGHDDEVSAETVRLILRLDFPGKEAVYREWCKVAIPRDPSWPFDRSDFDRHYGDEHEGGLAEALAARTESRARIELLRSKGGFEVPQFTERDRQLQEWRASRGL